MYPKSIQLPEEHQQLKQMVKDAQNNKLHVGMISALCIDSSVMPEECAIPDFGAPYTYVLPENRSGDFKQLVEEHKILFDVRPGKTTLDCHYITTKGQPIRVSPRRIPGHYHQKLLGRLNRC